MNWKMHKLSYMYFESKSGQNKSKVLSWSVISNLKAAISYLK